MKLLYPCIIFSSIICSIGFAAPMSQVPISSYSSKKVVVNNRVITMVNGNPITVIDLMKKMDLMFYQMHEEYLDSASMRYQFYMANWQEVLKNMIDRELVVLDAESQQMPVSPGDVREEIEEIFGPDVLDNIEDAGLTYTDVTKLIKADILIRRMLSYAVNMKAMKRVTPDVVAKEYENRMQQNQDLLLHYHIISVKSDDAQAANELSLQIKELINEQKMAPGKACAAVKEQGLDADKKISATLTPEFVQKKSEFAPHVYELLSTLAEGVCSDAQGQKGGYRLYYLIKKEEQKPLEFYEVEEPIRQNLIEQAMQEESERYFAHLRKHYDLNPDEILKSLPAYFKPFELK